MLTKKKPLRKKVATPEVLPFPTEEELRNRAKELGVKRFSLPSYKNIAKGTSLTLGGYSTISISPHPNCCGMKIVHTLIPEYNYSEEKEKQILLYLLRTVMYASLGNGVLQYTIAKEEQSLERKVLELCGWKKVHESINPKTENLLITYMYSLPEDSVDDEDTPDEFWR